MKVKIKRIVSLIMALVVIVASGAFNDLQIVKAADPVVTLTFKKLNECYVEKVGTVYNYYEGTEVASENIELVRPTLTSADTNGVIHMDVNTSITFKVTVPNNNWGAAVTDANHNGIGGVSVEPEELKTNGHGGECDGDIGLYGEGTELKLIATDLLETNQDYYLYVYNYGENGVSTEILFAKIQIYNPAETAEIVGDSFIVGTKSKTYTVNSSNSNKKAVTDRFKWSVNDTAKGSIGEDTGVLTAGDEEDGSVVITATATNGIVSAENTTNLIAVKKRTMALTKTVYISKSIPATSVSFKKSEYSIATGVTLALSEQVTKEPAASTDIFTWVSSDKTVATVDENGVVTGKSAGETIITVYGEDKSVYATCTLKVYVKAQGIYVYQGDAADSTQYMSLRYNNTTLLRVEVNGTNGSASTDEVVASSANGQLVKVEQVDTLSTPYVKYYNISVLQNVQSKTDCILTFTAKNSGVTSDFRVSVFPGVSDSASIGIYHDNSAVTTDTVDVYIGDKVLYKLSAALVNVSSSEPNDQFTWTFSGNNDYVSSITDDSSISIVGEKRGTTTLTVATKSNPNVKKSVNVNVLQAAQALFLSETTLTMSTGDVGMLTATMTPADADEKIEWSTTDSTVATVDATTGKITAVSEGQATIKAETSHSKISKTCTVVVKQGLVTLSTTTLTKSYGSADVTLSATVKDIEGKTITNPNLTWKTSNENVVTVKSSTNGKATVTFGKVGKAEITVIYGDGTSGEEHSAVCNVTVTEKMNNVSCSGLSEKSDEATEFTYRPNGLLPEFEVTAICDHDARGNAGAYTLVKDTDYAEAVSATVFNVGNYSDVLTGIDVYTGKKNVYFKVVAKDISDLSCQLPDVNYNGKAQTPDIELVYTEGSVSQTLVKGKDFNATYSNNTNVGTATVTITGKGNFTGTITATFEIKPYQIGNLTVEEITSPTYNGSALTPILTVKRDGIKIALEKDYVANYENNINAGVDTAMVTLTPGSSGNYAGTKTVYFSILPMDISKAVVKTEAVTYTGGLVPTVLTVTYNEMSLKEEVDFTTEYANNLDVGKATVTLNGTGNYTGTKSATFAIKQADLADVTVEPIAKQFYCGGALLTPTVKITNGYITLQEDEDYTVAYTNNTAVGTATVTITAVKNGNFTGTTTATFDIIMKDAINSPGDTIVVDGVSYVGETIYVDVKDIAEFDVTLSCAAGICDDVVYATSMAGQTNFIASTQLVNEGDGTRVRLSVIGKKVGTSQIYLETLSGKIRKTINVVVYSPATQMKIKATGSDEKTYDITDAQVSVIENHTLQLSTEFAPLDSTDVVSWSVSDESVAKINEEGLLTTLKPGSVRIVATVKATENSKRGLTASGVLTVVENVPATNITLDQTAITLKAGESKTLIATTLPEYNTEQLVWSSSDEKVATVTQNGKVTAVAQGSATITCSNFQGNVVANCQVNVYAPATAMEINVKEKTLKIGESFEVTASLTPATAAENIQWTVSQDGVVLIENAVTGVMNSSTIKVTALKAGQVTVTATSENTKKTASCTVAVVGNTKKVGKATISSIKNKKGKKIAVSWKKVSGANGYQVSYSTSKNFKGAKVKTTTKTSLKISKLKKKTYYVRVRAYTTTNKTKSYGTWSAVKKVKVKK